VERAMNETCKKLARKITFWLAAEVALNLVGLDNLADYSEFILSRNELLLLTDSTTPAAAIALDSSKFVETFRRNVSTKFKKRIFNFYSSSYFLEVWM
jgi:hypothetical protein